MLKIIVPLFIVLPRKTKEDRKMIINLNNYRNWHYIISNQVKEAYKESLVEQLTNKKFNTPIGLILTLYKGTKRISDRSNVLSIHEKFFCDAMVHYGCIPDDDDTMILQTHYTSGCIDKDNPRVEIDILSDH